MATIYVPPSSQAEPRRTAAGSEPDPLFDALVKYIQTSPGPSHVTASEIENIINSHANQDGGRAWLESVVQPVVNPGPIRVWQNHATAHGFLSTSFSNLTLYFTALGNHIFPTVIFRGTCKGFFPPQTGELDDQHATFYWDKVTDSQPVRMEVNLLSNMSILTVRFFNESDDQIAELLVNQATARLPDYPLKGDGSFKLPDGPR